MRLDLKSLSVQSKNTICLLREYQNLKGCFKKVKDIKGSKQVLTHKVSSMSVQENCKQAPSALQSGGWSSAVTCNGFWPPVQAEPIPFSTGEKQEPSLESMGPAKVYHSDWKINMMKDFADLIR